jgi:uncharacterized membrane protein
MTTYRLSTAEIPRREFSISLLPVERPLEWLRLGWEDFRARPFVSSAYGLVFALVGFALTFWLTHTGRFFAVPILTSGFALIAPVLAVGLYGIAKQRTDGRSAAGAPSVAAILRANRSSIALMGVVLLLVFLNWIMLSALLFGSVFQDLFPAWGQVNPLPVLFGESMAFLAVFGGMGLILAVLVFRMTALSLPMLVDQEVDVLNAIFASWKAVGENASTMTVWALIIGLLCGLGFLTFYLGLVVVVPCLGYASWHAYRDTLKPTGDEAQG